MKRLKYTCVNQAQPTSMLTPRAILALLPPYPKHLNKDP